MDPTSQDATILHRSHVIWMVKMDKYKLQLGK